jgi:prepilin peptidase CpaA
MLRRRKRAAGTGWLVSLYSLFLAGLRVSVKAGGRRWTSGRFAATPGKIGGFMNLPAPTLALFAVVAAAVVAGAAVDVATRRIPNRITFPAAVLILGLQTWFHGLSGLGDSLLGLIGALVFFLIPYAFRMLGGGDVKLMAVAGAGLGPSALLSLALFTSLAGGVQILLWMMAARLSQGRIQPGKRLCYGPAIAAGALAAMALPLNGQPYLAIPFPQF